MFSVQCSVFGVWGEVSRARLRTERGSVRGEEGVNSSCRLEGSGFRGRSSKGGRGLKFFRVDSKIGNPGL